VAEPYMEDHLKLRNGKWKPTAAATTTTRGGGGSGG